MRRFTVTEKFIIGAMVILAVEIGLPNLSNALEFQADKGVAFNFTAPLINSTSNKTFATGGNNTAFYVHSNDNTTFVACGTNTTHIASGIYLFQLNATEMNHSRVGVLYNGTGCLPQYFVINTVPKEALDVVDGIVDDILVDTGTTLDGKIDTIDTNVDSILEDTGTDIPATLTNMSGATFNTTTDSLEAIRNQGDAAWITATGFSTHSAADVRTEMDANSTKLGDILTNTTSIKSTVDTNLDTTVSSRSAFDYTANNVTVATNNDKTGYALSASQTFDMTGNITGNLSGSVGSVTGNVGGSVASVTGNVGGNVTGTIGGLTSSALADFFDTDSGTTYSSAVAGSVVKETADNAGGASLTAADIADAVWDEDLTAHTTTNTTGKKLSESPTPYDIGP